MTLEEYLKDVKAMPQCVVGIDPDVKKSGVVYLNTDTGEMIPRNNTLSKLITLLFCVPEGVVVAVEASHLLTSNWHLPKGCSARKAAAMGEAVGRCHEVGRMIVELCEHLDIPCVEVLPLPKNWEGKDGKMSQEEALERFKGWPPTANQEQRDAALIAYHTAQQIARRLGDYKTFPTLGAPRMTAAEWRKIVERKGGRK